MVIYNPKSTSLRLLESPEKDLWLRCDGKKSMAELVGQLAQSPSGNPGLLRSILDGYENDGSVFLIRDEDAYLAMCDATSFRFDKPSADRLNDGVSIHFAGKFIDPLEDAESILGIHRARYEFVSSYVSDGRVVDLGCGEGYGCEIIASEHPGPVLGVDVDPRAIDLAESRRQLSNLTFENIDACSPALPSDSFDVVSGLQLLEVVEDSDVLLKNITRILRTSGVCILSTSNHAMAHDRTLLGTPYTRREFYLLQLEMLSRKYFASVRTYCQGDFFSNISKYLGRRFGKELFSGLIPSEELAIHQNSINEFYPGSAMTFVIECRNPRKA